MNKKQNDSLPDSQAQNQENEYMSAEVLALYKQRLMRWQADLMQQAAEGSRYLDTNMSAHDALDIAKQEFDVQNQVMCADRRRYLLAEIEEALDRMNHGDYGYCEITGEPIGLRRLDCWPIARLSIQAQQIRENQFRLIAGLR